MEPDPMHPGHVGLAQAEAAPSVRLSEFLATPAGRYVLAWEQQALDALVCDLFGYHALQLGLPELDALRDNRMPLRLCASDRLLDPAAAAHAAPAAAPALAAAPASLPAAAAAAARAGSTAGWADAPPAPLADAPPAPAPRVAVINRYEELPFAAQSIDLVVLPHILEFSPEPHQVLREVERVLVPEGHVVITGFNPASLWGARQLLARVGAPPFLPLDGHFIALPRVKDWLKLLSFEAQRGRFGCYAPWARSQRWLDRWRGLEKAGDRWWPVLGSVYLLSAVKRVRGMRLVGRVALRRAARAAALAPAAGRAMLATGGYTVEVDGERSPANDAAPPAVVARAAAGGGRATGRSA